jgi:hypothetical protein
VTIQQVGFLICALAVIAVLFVAGGGLLIRGIRRDVDQARPAPIPDRGSASSDERDFRPGEAAVRERLEKLLYVPPPDVVTTLSVPFLDPIGITEVKELELWAGGEHPSEAQVRHDVDVLTQTGAQLSVIATPLIRLAFHLLCKAAYR